MCLGSVMSFEMIITGLTMPNNRPLAPFTIIQLKKRLFFKQKKLLGLHLTAFKILLRLFYNVLTAKPLPALHT